MDYIITDNKYDFLDKSQYIDKEDLRIFLELNPILAFDIETTGLDCHNDRIKYMQFANKEDAVLIDFNHVDYDVILLCFNFLSNKDKQVVIHNAFFELVFLLSYNVKIHNVYCTMLMYKLITNGLYKPADLYSVTKATINVELDKSIQKDIAYMDLDLEVFNYSLSDVKTLLLVKDKLDNSLYKLFDHCLINLENSFVRVLAHMHYHGINVDTAHLKEIKNEVTPEIHRVKNEIIEIKDNDKLFEGYWDNYSSSVKSPKEEFNVGSPQQKKALLKCIVPDLESTDKPTLEKYKDKHKIFSLFLKYSTLNKLIRDYTENLENKKNKKTGRIHMSFNQIVTTGRISVSNPPLQQIPSKGSLGAKIREAFKPRKGHVMVGGDYSQCELRILAHNSKDKNWLDAFNSGKDLHTYQAQKTFNIEENEVRNYFNDASSFRDVQKTINFGLSYGMSAVALSERIKTSIDDAQEIIDKFFNSAKGVYKYLTKSEKFAMSKGYGRSNPPFSRIKWFCNIRHINKLSFGAKAAMGRQGKNFPMQSTNADIMKYAAVKTLEFIENNERFSDIIILLLVHDEINTSCREDIAEEWKVILQSILEDAGNYVINSVPMPCDTAISNYWKK